MNIAPERLCSCGRDTLATYRVPAENTKSAPITAMMAAGKPNAQYEASGSIRAKRRLAHPVAAVPNARKMSGSVKIA